jgi:uncharacterized membrane protein
MEVLTLLLLVVLIIVIVSSKNSITDRLDDLYKKLHQINERLDREQPSVEAAPKPKPFVQDAPMPTPVEAPTPPQQENYWESNFKLMDEEGVVGETKPAFDSEEKEAAFTPLVEYKVKPSVKELLEQYDKQYAPPPAAPPKPSFFERNPDLEKFIGENLISKIGIGILVLAIGFFVKYAIDNNWIGEVGRVSIGLICGAILVGLAHKLRNNYKAFSSVLVGGGLAVFYFTMTLAHQRFHLFGPTPTIAFIIMVVITTFAVAISLLYDRQELAIISLVGGFLSPFLVSDGSGNYHALFIYLIILNAGLLVIAYNKAWRLLNLLAFVFTVIIFAAWLLQPRYMMVDIRKAMYGNGFIYATVFYLLFFVINIANNIKENKKFIASDFGILLANTAIYFGVGLYCLYEMNGAPYKGLFSASMGVFNLIASYLLFRKQKVDTNILYLLIGITLTFVSLTAPLQLHGNYITLFWASETVLLFWLYQKSKSNILQLSSLIIWIAMLLSLALDWLDVYENSDLYYAVVYNKGFLTGCYAAIATWLLAFLIKKQELNSKTWLPNYLYSVASIALLFIAGALEITFQFNHYYPNTAFNQIYLLLYVLVFISAMLLITRRAATWTVSVRMTLLCTGILLYCLAMPVAYSIQEMVLTKQQHQILFLAHWFSALVFIWLLYQAIQLLRKDAANNGGNSLFTWLASAIAVLFLSVETHLLINQVFYSTTNPLAEIERVFIKTGLPILWGLCSFTFMWLGMKHKYRTLRIVSLSLFSITLLKLFLFDISNIPIAGKIAAFFCLGVILLVVSFMYQRLKKMIIDDEKKSDV